MTSEEKKSTAAPDDYSVAPDPDQPAGVYDLSLEGGENPEDVYKQILGLRDESEPPKPKVPRGKPVPPSQPAVPVAPEPPAADAWETKYNELNERFLRSLADLDNMRKRQQKQAVDQRKFGHEGAIREILPVLDNLERALQAAPKESSGELAKFIEGTQMIVQQFFVALDRLGVKPVVAVGQPFDPALHEAIQELPSAEHPAGTIAAEMQKGYVLYDRVLRPAKVIISAGAPGEPAAANSSTEPPADLPAGSSDGDGPN